MREEILTEPVTAPKAPKDRSPSYPFISLKTAIDRLVSFDATFGRHPSPASKVGLAWKMKEASSQAAQTLAALKSFGLVDYQGAASDRIASISDDGRTYLRAQQESVKEAVLKRLALKPKAMEKYWTDWGADRPPDPLCLDRLVLKDGFTQSAAETFLRVYDDTVAFAKLGKSDKPSGVISDDEDEDLPLEDDEDVEVGDLVQVEIGGALQLPKPTRVRAIQEHQGARWVFIDGSETGILMNNIIIEEKARARDAVTPPTLPLMKEREQRHAEDGWHEERLLDDRSEEIFISYKGEPSVARYEFIRDYLDFRIQRQQKIEAAKPKPPASEGQV